MTNITIAVTLNLQKDVCQTSIDTPELEQVWNQLKNEIDELKANGKIIEIPWEPFD